MSIVANTKLRHPIARSSIALACICVALVNGFILFSFVVMPARNMGSGSVRACV